MESTNEQTNYRRETDCFRTTNLNDELMNGSLRLACHRMTGPQATQRAGRLMLVRGTQERRPRRIRRQGRWEISIQQKMGLPVTGTRTCWREQRDRGKRKGEIFPSVDKVLGREEHREISTRMERQRVGMMLLPFPVPSSWAFSAACKSLSLGRFSSSNFLRHDRHVEGSRLATLHVALIDREQSLWSPGQRFTWRVIRDRYNLHDENRMRSFSWAQCT